MCCMLHREIPSMPLRERAISVKMSTVVREARLIRTVSICILKYPNTKRSKVLPLHQSCPVQWPADVSEPTHKYSVREKAVLHHTTNLKSRRWPGKRNQSCKMLWRQTMEANNALQHWLLLLWWTCPWEKIWKEEMDNSLKSLSNAKAIHAINAISCV